MTEWSRLNRRVLHPQMASLSVLFSAIAVGCASAGCNDQSAEFHAEVRTRTLLKGIADQLRWYREEKGAFPPNEPYFAETMGLRLDLSELRTEVRNMQTVILDSWGTVVVYRNEGSAVYLLSFGPNTLDDRGKGDDIIVEVYRNYRR